MSKIVWSVVLVLAGLLFLSWWVPLQRKLNILSTAPPMNTRASDGTTVIFPCGAIFPQVIADSTFYLNCPSPMDLSGIREIKNSKIYTCALPLKMPVTMVNTQIEVVSGSQCLDERVHCEGNLTCVLTKITEDTTIPCGVNLPGYVSDCQVHIDCADTTDLGGIIWADGATFFMHRPPCRLPRTFTRSKIVLY